MLEPALRLFEKRLLERLGYGLELSAIDHGRAARAVRLSLPAGAGACPSKARGSAPVPCRRTLLGARARRVCAIRRVCADARALLRAALDRCLEGGAAHARRCACAETTQVGPRYDEHLPMLHLGVNVDHVATLRQARRATLSGPGARRADRRAGGRRQHHAASARGSPAHPGRDVRAAARTCCRRGMNLEMAATDEMVGIACEVRPADCCLVPEQRAEVTTEGGLDVPRRRSQRSAPVCRRLADAGIRVALFIDPDPRADRSRGAHRRAGHRAAHRRLRRGDAARSRRASSSGSRAAAARRGSLGLRCTPAMASTITTCSRSPRSPRSSSSTSGTRSSRAPSFDGLARAGARHEAR